MSLKAEKGIEKEIALAEKTMDILQYLPNVVGNIRECKAVAKAENPQLQKLWTALDGGLKDQFVEDSTIHGVKRMEAILSISPKGRETLEDRKRRILARLNETLPYTYRRLESWLLGVCGDENFYLTLEHEIYKITIGLEYAVVSHAIEIYNEARKIIPANMILRQLTTIDTEELAPVYLGVQSSIGIYTHVEPYQAGKNESESLVYVGAVSAIGVRVAIDSFFD